MKNKIKNKYLYLRKKFLIIIFRIFSIKNNQVICLNFYNQGYGDSPKYIANELLKYEKCKIIWVVNKYDGSSFPNAIKQVLYNSIREAYYIATSKIIISNVRMELTFSKRKKQLYFQTWHGCIGLKKAEFDVFDTLTDTYKKMMIKDNKNIDYMISNSSFCTKMYRNTFKYKGNILEIGTPRNDIYFNNESISEKVNKYFNLNNKKIILYAPTFRDDKNLDVYDINFNKVLSKIEKDYVVLVKLHPNIKDEKIYNYNENIINASDYPDIQELICSCETIITDYSSVMFDGLIANKKVYLYVNDIEKFKKERDLFFDIEKLPFSICYNQCDLIDNLQKKFNYNNYIRFKNDLKILDDGNSSKKICEFILSKMR